ncbi:MAG: endonuclease NucS [Pyrodictiaceae archaeon]
MEFILEPSLGTAASRLRDAITNKHLIIVLGRCSVHYSGRGASRLGPGDRLVIVKPDGAVLVHRPTGYSPVNWQPDSKIIEVHSDGGKLVLKSIREKPREVLEIDFEKLDAILVVSGAEDRAEFIEYMDEREIRDYLSRNPDIIEKGLRVISVERPVEPGFIDLYARDSKGNLVVVEIKRTTANRDAVLQLYRYVEALKRSRREARIRGILVAPSITKAAQSVLESLGLEYRPIDVIEIHRRASSERKAITRSILDYVGRRG